VSGDPVGVRASAVPYREFHDEAVGAAAQIRGLDTSLFVGPEGDQYREGLSENLPPHLHQAGEAFGIVATALTTFAGDLEGLQERMSPWRVRAPHLWADLQAAHAHLASAENGDQRHRYQQLAARAVFLPGQAPPSDSYRSQAGAASAGLGAAQVAWQQCLDAATGIQAEVEAAVERCERQIREASGMRFHQNPSGLGAVASGVGNVVTDHAAGLARLSGALKTVSAITGMMWFLPGMGEVALAVSIATGAAALAIDATTMAATGKWDPAVLAVDGLALLPVAGKIASKGFDAAEALRESRAATALEESSTELNATDKPQSPAKIGRSLSETFSRTTPNASDLRSYAEDQGWKASQTATGPLKYTDENGVVRMRSSEEVYVRRAAKTRMSNCEDLMASVLA